MPPSQCNVAGVLLLFGIISNITWLEVPKSQGWKYYRFVMSMLCANGCTPVPQMNPDWGRMTDSLIVSISPCRSPLHYAPSWSSQSMASSTAHLSLSTLIELACMHICTAHSTSRNKLQQLKSQPLFSTLWPLPDHEHHSMTATYQGTAATSKPWFIPRCCTKLSWAELSIDALAWTDVISKVVQIL